MKPGPITAIIRQQRRVVQRQRDFDLTDRQLLDGFISRHDEASFAILLWRHASSVYRVCRSILRDSEDAEDAWQASFAILANKAGSIAEGVPLAGWLHTVAHRIAQHMRVRRDKHGVAEELQDIFAAPESLDESHAYDLRQVLDEEMAHLPEKYRTVLRLCYLEGLTNESAARQLGCPLGTLQSRLSRAREKLHDRFVRRGVAPHGSTWKSHKMTMVFPGSSMESPLGFTETCIYEVAGDPPPAQTPGHDESPLS